MNATAAAPDPWHTPSRSPVHFAAGRCTAAILFSIFGAAWLALSLLAFGLLHWPAVLLLMG